MDIYKINDMAELIAGNPYVGRGIVIGKSADGKKAAIAYFIMGRSANSRNRIFTEKNGEVFTEPFDVSKVQDPSLIIYAAIRQFENKLIVTNGDQTDTIYDSLKAGGFIWTVILGNTVGGMLIPALSLVGSQKSEVGSQA